MRKGIYILVCLLWISCANETKSSKFEMADEEFLETPMLEVDMDVSKTIKTQESLAINKLLDYVDLIKLKNQHPEFREDIMLQLQALTKDTLVLPYTQIVAIQNIRQSDSAIHVNDTLQHLHLYFDVISNNKTYPDSIRALITSRTILLDDKPVISSKVRFEKIVQ